MASARCNFGGQPMSPGDARIVETFATWLQMDDEERRDAVRLDPAWRRFLAGGRGSGGSDAPGT